MDSKLRALVEQWREIAIQIVDALSMVPVVRVCYCGAPITKHEFWDDKIYDVQGYKCPGGGEFREGVTQTKATYRQKQIEIVSALLAQAQVEEVRQSICRYCGEDIRQDSEGWMDRETGHTCEAFDGDRHHLPVAPDIEAELFAASRKIRTLEARIVELAALLAQVDVTCTCGHVESAHETIEYRGTGKPRHCLFPDCNCRRYKKELTHAPR